MKKLFTPFILLLCAAAVTLGAYLPRISASWRDDRLLEKPGYAAMSDLELSVTPGALGTMKEKLGLLGDYTSSMAIPKSMATMSDHELLALVNETVRIYQRSGLFPTGLTTVTKDQLDAQALLLRLDEESMDRGTFWDLYVGELDPMHRYSLHLTVDDESGRVCALTFTDTHWQSAEGAAFSDPEGKMLSLCRPYLEGLGDEFSAFDPEDVAASMDSVSQDFHSAEVSWNDLIYGNTRICFTISTREFYVTVI